jgi:exopolysaccharide production protein ExoQ
MKIWQFTAESIAVRPVAGWGLNASRSIPGGTDEVSPGTNRLPLHPHNAILQWWLELGAVGAAIGTALIVSVVFRAGQIGGVAGPDAAGPAALAATASALTVALVSYGIWQSWWIATLWLATTFTAAVGGAKR